MPAYTASTSLLCGCGIRTQADMQGQLSPAAHSLVAVRIWSFECCENSTPNDQANRVSASLLSACLMCGHLIWNCVLGLTSIHFVVDLHRHRYSHNLLDGCGTRTQAEASFVVKSWLRLYYFHCRVARNIVTIYAVLDTVVSRICCIIAHLKVLLMCLRWWLLVNEKICILIQRSPKFVPKGPIDNKAALVYIMAWHWICNKPLSEPMLTQFTGAYMQSRGRWILTHRGQWLIYASLVQILACRLVRTKPLSEPMLKCC